MLSCTVQRFSSVLCTQPVSNTGGKISFLKQSCSLVEIAGIQIEAKWQVRYMFDAWSLDADVIVILPCFPLLSPPTTPSFLVSPVL